MKLYQENGTVSPSLFLPPSEEDLVRSMIALSNELKYVKDLPQASISFPEQRSNTLTVHVVLLRVVPMESNKTSVQEMSKALSPHIRFIPERVAIVGNLRGKYEKEATVFILELDNHPFLRKNHSVDLVKARRCVVAELEKMIGPFVDHNTQSLPQAPSKEAKVPQEPQLQSLRLTLPRAAQSLNPHAGADRSSGILIRMLYEGLCRMNAEGKVEPAIARDIHISEDRKRYTFHLKETYWSNGAPLTAHDFEYAWKKILHPEYHSPYSFLFFSLRNAEAVKKGDKPITALGVSALNDQTLEVHLEYPAPYFLELTACWLFSPLSLQIDQKHPGWAYHSGATHVCNGPYKLDLWKLNDDVQLLKNPLYWDASRVKLDQIHISIIPEEKKALDLFSQGELDWVGDPLSKIALSDHESLNRQGLLHIDPTQYGLFWLQLNTEKPPFNNVKMRRAFGIGTNRKKLVQRVFNGNPKAAFGFSGIKEQAFPAQFADGDEKEALRLFEEGLKEMGITRKEFPTLVISHSEIEEHVVIHQALGEQWKRLFGIEVELKKVVWTAYFEALHHNDFIIGGLSWYPRFSDPIYFYDLFVRRPYAIRVSSWNDPSYRQIVTKAKEALDPQVRREALFQADKILIETMQAIPLFYQDSCYMKNPRLKGYIPSLPNQIDFRMAYFESDEAS